MNPITYLEALQTLRRAGFVGTEIDRLYRLRRNYRMSELDQAPLDPKRLEFARWLVTTRRLTEQMPEEETRTMAPPKGGWHRLKIMLAASPYIKAT